MGVREIGIKIYMYIYEKIYLFFELSGKEWKESGQKMGFYAVDCQYVT